MTPLQHLIAETMADSLGGVPADAYEETAGDVLEAIAEAGYRIDRAGAIVKALAECDPLGVQGWDGEYSVCVLCPEGHQSAHVEEVPEWFEDPGNHHPSCPWRMAREVIGDE